MTDGHHVEYMPLDDIAPATRNPKAHDTAGIKRSITHHGVAELPLIDDRTGQLIAGHGRLDQLRAMRDNGDTPPAGVRVDDGVWLAPVLRGWSSRSDDDAEAYLIASNRLTEKGGWDDYGLAEVLTDMAEAQLLELTGYDSDDLAALIASLEAGEDDEEPVALTDKDDAPGFRSDTVTKPGDLWHLGPHRLAVGDSTDVTVWDLLLGGDKADMVWTDPPYGVAYIGKTKDALTIENDTLSEDGLDDFLRAVFGVAMVSTNPGAAWYVAGPPGPLHLVFGQALHDLEILRQTIIWVKDQFVMGRSDYHYRHEPIYYGWTPGAAHHPVPDRRQDTIHEVPRPKRSKDHPTMKPVDLIVRHIENSTDKGGLVVDPFGGSGSTLIACHTTGRRAALIELDPKYADVILRRFEEHTGIVPTRGGEPHSFVDDLDDLEPVANH